MPTFKNIEQADKCVERANILTQNAKYDDAIQLLIVALKAYYKNELWDKYVKTCIYIGLNYNSLAIPIATETYLQNALEVAEKKMETDHFYTSEVYMHLGLCFTNKGDYERSLYYHKLALDMRLRL